MPTGYTLAAPEVHGVELGALAAEELNKPPKAGLVQIGVRRALPAGAARAQAVESVLSAGQRIWRVKLRSPGAVGLRLHFTGFAAGAGRVWVYAPSGGVAGPYTGAGPHGDGEFWSGAIDSDTAIVEYEPAAGAAAHLPFEIDALSHEWQSPLADSAGPVSAAASCNLDVSCYNSYSSQATAVVRISFQAADDSGSYVCSGSLINTASSNFLPYVYTANHCISTESEAQSVIAYFRYQTDSCNGQPPGLFSVPRVEGAQYLAGAPLPYGDYSLILLDGSAPAGSMFLGWNAAGPAIGESVYSIHHPRGSWKRISFGKRTADKNTNVEGILAPADRYYQILYTSGITEPGSSGAPVVNSNHQIIGTITAGPDFDSEEAACWATITDVVGRFSNAYPTVKQWLEEEAATCFASPAAGHWKGEYFDNQILYGSPIMVRDDGGDMLAFNWGAASPGAGCGVPVDGFSARWTRTVTLDAGRYRFQVTADDGVRLYIDGALTIDQWKVQAATEYFADVDLAAGAHTIVLEYYDDGGAAVAKLSWGKLISCYTTVAEDRWRGEYFDNASLNGGPVMVRDDGLGPLAFDWGGGTPGQDCGVPADDFSVRWTRTFSVDAGRYRLTTRVDDGVRAWVDGELKIDQWKVQSPTTYTADLMLPAGAHTVVVEYFDAAGGAVADLNWEALPPCTAAVAEDRWKGEYFDNMTFAGAPAMVRDDGAGALAFEWGAASPDLSCGVPADEYSVRWSRTVPFTAGQYRFRVTGDDGVRLAIDGSTVIDQWKDQSPTEYTADVDLAAGSHNLVLEYYENQVGAVAKLSWECLSGGCQSTPLISNVTLQGDPGVGTLFTLTGGFDFTDGDGDVQVALPCPTDDQCAWLHLVKDPPDACDVRWAAPFLHKPGQTSGRIEINLQYTPRVSYWAAPGSLPIKVSLIDAAGHESNVITAEPVGPDGYPVYACPIVQSQ